MQSYESEGRCPPHHAGARRQAPPEPPGKEFRPHALTLQPGVGTSAQPRVREERGPVRRVDEHVVQVFVERPQDRVLVNGEARVVDRGQPDLGLGYSFVSWPGLVV